MKKKMFVSIASFFCVGLLAAQEKQSTETPEQQAAKTEVWSPVPKKVDAAVKTSEPPADAYVLFNGKSLNEWVLTSHPDQMATWIINKDGSMMVNKNAGNIQTKKSFTDYQLHLEFKIPATITGEGQARGNSGLFLASTGSGDAGYEIQILDNYTNKTYVNGQCGSVYKQFPPLVNACRKAGEWQSYDIIWTAPRFNEDGSLKSPARVTVFQNGILVQNNTELKGETRWIGTPEYHKHGACPIKLQAHGDKSEPISFRNIWVREL
ncbi:MAG: DUF1080 domain-containing protein [Bacteroidota bacterium]|nr:DUF1080 domain-containing protein [Bacteroidota bacterium]